MFVCIAALPQQNRIAGKLVYADGFESDRFVLEGIEVEARAVNSVVGKANRDNSSILLKTDSGGTFEFRNLSGTFRISALSGPLVSYSIVLQVREGVDLLDVELPVFPAFETSGRIVDPEGRPVYGQVVWQREAIRPERIFTRAGSYQLIPPKNYLETVTGEDGQFFLPKLSSHSWRMVLWNELGDIGQWSLRPTGHSSRHYVLQGPATVCGRIELEDPSRIRSLRLYGRLSTRHGSLPWQALLLDSHNRFFVQKLRLRFGSPLVFWAEGHAAQRLYSDQDSAIEFHSIRLVRESILRGVVSTRSGTPYTTCLLQAVPWTDPEVLEDRFMDPLAVRPNPDGFFTLRHLSSEAQRVTVYDSDGVAILASKCMLAGSKANNIRIGEGVHSLVFLELEIERPAGKEGDIDVYFSPPSSPVVYWKWRQAIRLPERGRVILGGYPSGPIGISVKVDGYKDTIWADDEFHAGLHHLKLSLGANH